MIIIIININQLSISPTKRGPIMREEHRRSREINNQFMYICESKILTPFYSQSSKFVMVTLDPSMLHSPPHPVMPSSQPMSMPPPPQREAVNTMSP